MSPNTNKTAQVVDLSKHRKIDAKTKLEASQRMIGWSDALTGAEVKLLQWLRRVTVEWNQWSGDFSDIQILKGIPKSGITGAGISEATLKRAKRSLERRGVLRVGIGQGWGGSGRRKTRYTINLNWTPEQGGKARKGGPEREPSRGSKRALTGLKISPLSNVVSRDITSNPLSERTLTASGRSQEGFSFFKKEEARAETPNLSGQTDQAEPTRLGAEQNPKDRDLAGRDRETARPDGFGEWRLAPEKVAQVNQSSAAPSAPAIRVRTRTRPSLATVTPPATPSATPTTGKPWEARIDELRRVWEKAWSETYSADAEGNPNGCAPCPAWSKGERGMLAGFARYFVPREPLPEFIDFVVRRWRIVIIDKRGLGWVKKMALPEYPSIRFMCWEHARVALLNAWADQRNIAWRKDLPKALHRVEELRARGATTDEAVMEVATDRARSIDRERNEKTLQDAKLYCRMGENIRAEAVKIIRSRSVKHPQSRQNLPPPKVNLTKEACDAFEGRAPIVIEALPLEPFEPGEATPSARPA
jgi:hypothetical protein